MTIWDGSPSYDPTPRGTGYLLGATLSRIGRETDWKGRQYWHYHFEGGEWQESDGVSFEETERREFDDACWQDRCQWGELIDSTLAIKGQKPYALVKRALSRVPAEAHWLVDEKAGAKWPLTFGGRRASGTV